MERQKRDLEQQGNDGEITRNEDYKKSRDKGETNGDDDKDQTRDEEKERDEDKN